jgi:hypothetical protein
VIVRKAAYLICVHETPRNCFLGWNLLESQIDDTNLAFHVPFPNFGLRWEPLSGAEWSRRRCDSERKFHASCRCDATINIAEDVNYGISEPSPHLF